MLHFKTVIDYFTINGQIDIKNIQNLDTINIVDYLARSRYITLDNYIELQV